MNDQEVRERVAQAETLLAEIEALSDPAIKALAMTTVQRLLELYGEGLARLMAQATRLGNAALQEAYLQDELISHLLLLHDLHPATVEERIERALDEVRPYMASHGGSVELLGVTAGVAQLRLLGSCHGCPASLLTMQERVEQALAVTAPDLLGIAVDGLADSSATQQPTIRPKSAPIALEGIAADD